MVKKSLFPVGGSIPTAVVAFVTASLLKNLLAVQHDTGLPIVASAYEDNLGTPAFFHKSLFPELMELKGDTGARKLIKQHEDLVCTKIGRK